MISLFCFKPLSSVNSFFSELNFTENCAKAHEQRNPKKLAYSVSLPLISFNTIHAYLQSCFLGSFWGSIAEDYAAVGPPTGFQGIYFLLPVLLHYLKYDNDVAKLFPFCWIQVSFHGSSFLRLLQGCTSMLRYSINISKTERFWVPFLG